MVPVRPKPAPITFNVMETPPAATLPRRRGGVQKSSRARQRSWIEPWLCRIDSLPTCALSSPKRRPRMAKYDSILGTVGNTPVVRINRLAPDGVNLYVKVEAFNPLGSVKDRLALGVI